MHFPRVSPHYAHRQWKEAPAEPKSAYRRPSPPPHTTTSRNNIHTGTHTTPRVPPVQHRVKSPNHCTYVYAYMMPFTPQNAVRIHVFATTSPRIAGPKPTRQHSLVTHDTAVSRYYNTHTHTHAHTHHGIQGLVLACPVPVFQAPRRTPNPSLSLSNPGTTAFPSLLFPSLHAALCYAVNWGKKEGSIFGFMLSFSRNAAISTCAHSDTSSHTDRQMDFIR